MKIARFATAVAVLAGGAAALAAQSDGIAEMKGTVRSERGETVTTQTKAWISRAGVRLEMTMDLSQIAGRKDRGAEGVPSVHREILIYKSSEPNVTYDLNVERKTYSVFQHSSEKGEAKTSESSYTVTKLGRDSVAGFSCERVLLKRAASADETELCVSKDVGASGAWLDAMYRRRGGSPFRALSDAGVTGFPIRTIVRRSGAKDAMTTLELTRFEKTSVPASTFEIPAGYKKVTGYDTRMTPEQEEAMRKAMENMTPEQRKQFEEMLKKQKGDD